MGQSGRPRGSKGKVVETRVKQTTVKKQCRCCLKEKAVNGANSGFYVSNNVLDADGRTSACKECIKNLINYDDILTVKEQLRNMNRPFLSEVWVSSLEESESRGRDLFGQYIKNVQMPKYKDLGWDDSQKNNESNEKIISVDQRLTSEEFKTVMTFQDEQNKEDVLRMVGYDPFEMEPDIDKKHLYNKLVDFLDEGTLEDSFKLPAVIEIVKTYSQIDKINSAISSLSSDVHSLSDNIGTIKSLSSTKKSMLDSVLALAKDNGISVNHNNNKSKGAGTLSGIIKSLHEKSIEAVDINVFDIETCEGMKQVADISNRSIMEQLMLNENDYSEMIKDQKELIHSLRNKCEQLEEENRLIKIKLKENGLARHVL